MFLAALNKGGRNVYFKNTELSLLRVKYVIMSHPNNFQS